MDYLPKDATIEQTCNWLQAQTSETWILPRLLECHLTPYFWLDYKQGYPTVYGNRIEGYQSRMMFQGDLCRLESDGGYALVNMFAAHDGALIEVEPGVRVALSDLRFKRDRVERVAEIINSQKTAPAQSPATPAPVETVEQRRARWLDWHGKGERGAVQRVYERELLLNPKADRSFIGKEIDKAKNEKAETKRGGAMFGQLVQDGKRMG